MQRRMVIKLRILCFSALGIFLGGFLSSRFNFSKGNSQAIFWAATAYALGSMSVVIIYRWLRTRPVAFWKRILGTVKPMEAFVFFSHALLALAFFQYFNFHYYFHNIDLLDVLHPSLYTFYQYLRRHELLIWNPHVGAGHPAIVWGHYPLNQFSPLYYLFGYNDISFNIVLCLSVFLCLLSTYLFLRHVLHCGPWASLLGSLAYLPMPSVGQYVLHIVHLNSTLFSPFLIWAIYKLFLIERLVDKGKTLAHPATLRRRRLLVWVIVTLCLCLSLVSTKADLWLYILFLFGFTWIFFGYSLGSRKRSLVRLALIGGGTLVFSLLGYCFPILLISYSIFQSNRLDFDHTILRLMDPQFFLDLLNNTLDSPYGITGIVVLIVAFLWRKLCSRGNQLMVLGFCLAGLLFFLCLSPFFQRPLLIEIVLIISTCLMAWFLAPNDDSPESQYRSWTFRGVFLYLLYPAWLLVSLYHKDTELGRLDDTLSRGLYGYVCLGFFSFAAFSRMRTLGVQYAKLGFLLVLFCRYHLQQIFIQCFGVVWHPWRDNFLLYLFVSAVTARTIELSLLRVGLRPLGGVRKRVIDSVMALFLGGCLFTVAIGNLQYFLFHKAYAFSSKEKGFIGVKSEELVSFFQREKVGTARILSLPSPQSLALDPWTSLSLFNPNILQYYDTNQISFYDSISIRHFSYFINKINYGPRFILSNPVINHAFPDLILRYFPIPKLKHEKESDLFKLYTYLRLIPLTINNKLLNIMGVKYILSEEKIDVHAHLRLSSPRDRLFIKERFQFRFDEIRPSPTKAFYIYQNLNEPMDLTLLPIGKLVHVSEISECLNYLVSNTFLSNDSHIVNSPAPWGGSNQDLHGKTKILEQNNAYVKIKAEALRPSLLYRPVAFSPLWRVRVNGAQRTITLANCAFQSVYLEPGSNIIEFYLSPPFYKVSAYVNLGWWVFVGFLFLFLHIVPTFPKTSK